MELSPNSTFASSAPSTYIRHRTRVPRREGSRLPHTFPQCRLLRPRTHIRGPPGSEPTGRSLVFVWTSAVCAITYTGQARANNMVIFAHQRRRDHCRHMGSGKSGHRNECLPPSFLTSCLVLSSVACWSASEQSYSVDTYQTYSASAIAGQTIVRSLTGAVIPLFTTQMFVNVGINWASTLLGAIAVLFVPMPSLFYKYGSHIRTRSSLTPCTDLEVVKFLEEEKEGAVMRGVQQMA
ncbi:hypothetical protein EDB85DRAFT_2091334 [Lactarius pseudohatsudake]|nr:hypothetical protein EDB85DRAFT_2091334 [Lactarius pseudohatsudake]